MGMGVEAAGVYNGKGFGVAACRWLVGPRSAGCGRTRSLARSDPRVPVTIPTLRLFLLLFFSTLFWRRRRFSPPSHVTAARRPSTCGAALALRLLAFGSHRQPRTPSLLLLT
jgi:hypothetical protein